TEADDGYEGIGVAVGGTGVAVGGTGVGVGGTGVAVGAAGLAVGGTDVAVGAAPAPVGAADAPVGDTASVAEGDAVSLPAAVVDALASTVASCLSVVRAVSDARGDDDAVTAEASASSLP